MKTVALAEICDFASGGTPSRADESFYTGTIPWITGADIVGDRINPRSYITDSAIAASAAKIVPSGTVLLVTRTSVGKVAIADRDMSFSQDITALVPNEGKLQRRFLVHFLRSKHAYFSRHARGATIKGITRSVVMDLQIPDLPLSEQRRIADILDKVDVLRAKRRQAIARLDALGQSIFHEMFGHRWITANGAPSHFQDAVEDGPQNGFYLPASAYGSGTPIVRIDSFRNGVIEDLHQLKRLAAEESDRERFGLNPGDVLVNRVNSLEHLGKIAIVPELAETTVFESNMMRCRLKPAVALAEFVLYAWMTPELQMQIRRKAKKSINQASINQKDVSGFEFAFPPLKLQQEFAHRIATLDSLKAKHRAQLAELDNLFLSLQDRAFKGEL